MSRKTAFPHTVIRASAGTGKTYQLAARFIGLLSAGARPDEILATTFTRKAAGEVLDRMLFWLAQAAADDGERARLVKATGDKSLTADKCRELLIATVRRLHMLRVGTLDSYFLQVATSFGHELGLPPGWSICDELIDALLRDEAIELVLSRGRLSDLATLVHSLTKGAAARSVARLVSDTVSSLFELYRETEPAAWERIGVCKGLTPEEMEETLEAIAKFTLPEGQWCKTRDKDLEKARLGEWERLLEAGFAAKVHTGGGVFNRKPLPPELISLYQRLLTHAESILVGQIARQTEATHQLLSRFAEHYYALQLDEGALRFSDVTLRLAQGTTTVGLERLAYRLDGGIRHVLLDEFQDTSPPQWRVLRPLAESVTSGPGGSFFCVGDAKQAIYGWRGGVAEIFDALEGQLKGLTRRNLDESYRSAQPVIETVNAVFQNLTKHSNLDKLSEPVRRWQIDFPEHSTARKELNGYVTLITAPQATDDEDQTEGMFRYAAERIRDCVAAAPQANIGVLVRTNAAVAKLIYRLRTLGIAASEEGGNPLVDSPAVELILSLLKLADHPSDLIARFHLATSPLAEHLTLHDHRQNARAAAVSQELRRELMDNGYGATVYHFARLLAPSCDNRDLSRLQQLVELAYEYQPSSTLRTSDFIRLVETRRVADPQASGIRVMTIHQAKGLQFDVVFLPELEARLVGQPDRFVAGRAGPTDPVNIVCRLANENVRQFFPPSLQKLFEDDMCLEVSESLCVLYVAMTRAIHALHMIIAPAKPSEKSLPKTFAGLLRSTLAAGMPAAAGVTLYEHGDAKWYRHGHEGETPSATMACKTKARQQPRSPIRLVPAAASRQRLLDRTSPSALEGGEVRFAASVLKERSPEALGIGTLFHAWLAAIDWIDDGLPDDEVLLQIAARERSKIGNVPDRLEEHIARFRQQLAAAPLAAVLSRRLYESPADLGLGGRTARKWPGDQIELTVKREHPFAIRTGDEILTGSIDRLIMILHNGRPIAADVIDFKTDDLSAGDDQAISDKTDFYRPQMDGYRRAVSQLLKLPPAMVGARLVFLAAGRSVPA
jgi:ATP-dependent helicase/nuclease subunit A